MPMPLSPKAVNAIVPAGFDPNQHCGAYTGETRNTLCMHKAGYNTDHPGEGRCKYHGGRTPIKGDGTRSILPSRRPVPIGVLFDQELRNPNLLRLDVEVAELKAVLRRQFALIQEADEQYADMAAEILEKAQEEGWTKKQTMDTLRLLMPELDTSVYDTLMRTVNTQYNMQFSRKFAVSIQEFAAAMDKVYSILIEKAQEYDVPDGFLLAVADELKRIKISRPADVTLEAAGQDRRPVVIDQAPA
jgi:hypothetical protein